MARLEVIQGRAQPTALSVEGELVLGRAVEAQVQVLDETASRRHALIRQEGGRTVLTDLGSANGTRLNGERVERPAALFDGDVIEIGSVRHHPGRWRVAVALDGLFLAETALQVA